MNAYLDTSAVVALVLKEDRWRDIVAWLESAGAHPSFSDFGRAEFIAAIALRVRTSGISPAAGRTIISGFDHWLADWRIHRMTSADVGDAAALVGRFEFGLRLPDAIHIALARRKRCTLVTLDVKQLDAARSVGVDSANPLAD